MNKVFLCNKHNAALTVSLVVLRIHLPFYFKHILCGYSASQNWAAWEHHHTWIGADWAPIHVW